jgi:hypothetical protein
MRPAIIIVAHILDAAKWFKAHQIMTAMPHRA